MSRHRHAGEPRQQLTQALADLDPRLVAELREHDVESRAGQERGDQQARRLPGLVGALTSSTSGTGTSPRTSRSTAASIVPASGPRLLRLRSP